MQSLFGPAYTEWISNIQKTLGPVPTVLIFIAIALIGGFAITRLCKLAKLPYVTGYIILGILMGPSLLAIISSDMLYGVAIEGQGTLAGLSFVGDLTMGFIAFASGRFFKWENIKSGGVKPIIVSLLSSLTIAVFTGGLSYLIYGVTFNKGAEYGIAPALFFGSISSVIALTATGSIVRQYKARGHFVERIYQNILTADVFAILTFSIILGLSTSGILGGVDVSSTSVVPAYEAFKPIISTIVFCLIGALCALILGKLNNYKRTNDSRIILTVAFITIIVAICSINYSAFNYYIPFSAISPLLPCMAFGIIYFNLSKSESLFFQLENFLPPILCLFFVVSGAKLQISEFQYAIISVTAICFVIFRAIAQFGSLQVYARAFGCSRNTRNYLPMTMMTMTGVAVGLINLASAVLPKNEMITFVYTVVLASCVILEIIGPIFTRLALIKTYSADLSILVGLYKKKDTKEPDNKEEDIE